MVELNYIINREGKKDRFDSSKIRGAINKAVKQIYAEDNKIELATNEIYDKTLKTLEEMVNGSVLKISDIENTIINVAKNMGYGSVGETYNSYKTKREIARNIFSVVESENGSVDSTDKLLLIESEGKERVSKWERSRIVSQLEEEANLSKDLAKNIAKQTENIIVDLYQRGVRKLNTYDIRGIVDIVLRKEGLDTERKMQELLGIPTKDLEGLILSKSQENSNVATNNTEAVNLGIAETILKQYGLNKVFSEDVKKAHMESTINIHDLGYIDRVYCSSHSLEFIKKYGLNKSMNNLESKSSPPNSAAVLNQHVQTFLASKQSDYAGALGFGFLNIFYSPLLNRVVNVIKGKTGDLELSIEQNDLEKLIEQGVFSFDKNNKNYLEKISEKKELKEVGEKEFYQTAQNLIFASSQNAFSRGGQTLFIDFNVHAGVPDYLKNVPAIGVGGEYMVKMPDDSVKRVNKIILKSGHIKGDLRTDDVPRFNNPNNPDDLRNGDADDSQLMEEYKGGHIITYGDLEKTSQKFAKALLKVWKQGDMYGRPFHFPKCDFHVDKRTFENPNQIDLMNYAAEVTSENGSVYFMFDRGDDAILAQCCRLKTKVEDKTMLKYPERLSFVGFQNITINIPQAAYKSKKKDEGLEGTIKEIENSMEIAYKAHIQKKSYIQKLLDTDGSPLRGAGKPVDDGKPYIVLDKATYIIGCIGLNEAVQTLTGEQLHESENAYKMGLELISAMSNKIKDFKKRSGLLFTIEETPAESTTRKFAKVDWDNKEYGNLAREVIKGTHENPYYTNSIHFAPDADVGLVDRIYGQSNFHEMISSGAIVHAWVGEKRPDKEVIKNIVENTLKNTNCAQLVFSPTYTECDECGNVMKGDKELCTIDGCTNSSYDTLNKETISAVTRIVGYNSRLSHWNGSQQQIYKDRKKAEEFYSSSKGRDMSWLYNPSGNGKLTIYQFGKTNCKSCENTQNNIEKKLKELGVDDKVDFKVYYLDGELREGLVKASMYGIPLDSVPSIVIAGKNDYWKKTTAYSKNGGRSDLIKPKEVGDEILKRINEYP